LGWVGNIIVIPYVVGLVGYIEWQKVTDVQLWMVEPPHSRPIVVLFAGYNGIKGRPTVILTGSVKKDGRFGTAITALGDGDINFDN